MQVLFNYLKAHWRLVLLSLALAAINQVFSLLDPLIFRHVIDEYATKFEQYTLREFLRGVSVLLLGAIGVAFVSRVAKNFQDFYVNLITQRVGAKIYCDGLAHSLKLPYSVFEDQQSGATLGRLQKVRIDVERVISAAVNNLFTTSVGFVFVISYAVSVHWAIGPAYFLTVPIIGALSTVLGKRIKVVQAKILAETAALAGATTESLRNIELVKSLGLASQEIERLSSATQQILKLELKKIRYVRSLSFLQGTVINFLRTSLMFMMLYLIFTREITFGQFFSLYMYSFFLFGPLQELGNVIGLYHEAQASLTDFAQLMQQPTEKDPEQPARIGALNEIAFRDVSFKYPTAKGDALSGISFSAKRGATIAFVGPSGSGKTSLVKLLVGLYKPSAGDVLYNGQSASSVELGELREQIGFVTQETQLFAGTLRENLLFVNPKATDEECITAMKMSACQNLLQRANEGLSTLIGEGGVKVSGGERQRLSIARALLRKPRLLVFDEATSSLDSITEEEITKTIEEVASSSNVITILIAHRLSTIMHADIIYCLEKGKIVESGPHKELIEAKGLYYAMWRQQVGEDIG